MAPSVFFWYCSPSASRFDIFCIQRCFPACLGCNRWLFELLLPFCQLETLWPFSSDINKIFSHRTAAHWINTRFYVGGKATEVKSQDSWMSSKILVLEEDKKRTDSPIMHQQGGKVWFDGRNLQKQNWFILPRGRKKKNQWISARLSIFDTAVNERRSCMH